MIRVFLLLCVLTFCCHAEENKDFSYYLGYKCYLDQFNRSETEIDVEKFVWGVKEAALNNKDTELTEEKIGELQDFCYEQLKLQKLEESNRYLAQIKLENDVKEIVKDKIFIKIEKMGSGEILGNYPKISYITKRINKSALDPIQVTMEPKIISLKDTIEGFQIGMKDMRVGEKRTIYIHPDMAYGVASWKVPPNSVVIFEVEAFE